MSQNLQLGEVAAYLSWSRVLRLNPSRPAVKLEREFDGCVQNSILNVSSFGDSRSPRGLK